MLLYFGVFRFIISIFFEFSYKNKDGYNSSILAYGNTNSGKTYTLYGDRTDSESIENNGLIYYSLNYFFQLQNINKVFQNTLHYILNTIPTIPSIQYFIFATFFQNMEISISIVEIYLEKTRDLGKIK